MTLIIVQVKPVSYCFSSSKIDKYIIKCDIKMYLTRIQYDHI